MIAGGVLLHVRAQPRAGRNAIEGQHAGALKVRLTAPPVEGRANESLRRLLAERLNVPVAAVRIASGQNSRDKRVSIAGVTPAQMLELLALAPVAKKKMKD